MGAHTSLVLTEGKAREIVFDFLAAADREQLRRLASRILSERSLYNIARIVERDEPNDDDEVPY